jgi:hypothetical protein
MRKIVEVTEVSGEGLEALLGQKVILLCLNYFYTGVLEGISSDCVLLALYVQRGAIESFGLGK